MFTATKAAICRTTGNECLFSERSGSQSSIGRICSEKHSLKRRFGLSESFELKWGKVSQGRADYYDAVLRWFWQNPCCTFGA